PSATAAAAGRKAACQERCKSLLQDLGAVDGDPMPFAGVEHDLILGRKLREGKGPGVIEPTVDQDAPREVDYPDRQVGRGAAVRKPAFAGHGVVALIEAAADGVVG